MAITLRVNGATHTVDVEPATPLLYILRNDLDLHGPHFGCGLGQCGACTVHVNGQAVKSCNMLAMQAEGATVTTIEGIAAPDGTLHPMQQAFHLEHGLQCGYCTPGMVMSAIDLLRRNPDPTDDQIREQLDGNLCRCTGYQAIVDAIESVLKAQRVLPLTQGAAA